MLIAVCDIRGSAETEGVVIYSRVRCEKGFAFDFVVLVLIEGSEEGILGLETPAYLEFLVLFISFPRSIL